jgi:purine-binding chemotaxis protein CheW
MCPSRLDGLPIVSRSPLTSERGDTVPAETLPVLVFEVGGRRYGLPAADVRELLRAVAILPLPQAPPAVEGIINLRGTIVPVLDLRQRFRLPARPLEHTDHFIVAGAGDRTVALRVDRAVDLIQLDAADLEDMRGVVPGVEYVTWVARLPHDLVLIHDLRTFLSRSESLSLDEALASQAPADAGGGP